jgi:hypothetical protein
VLSTYKGCLHAALTPSFQRSGRNSCGASHHRSSRCINAMGMCRQDPASMCSGRGGTEEEAGAGPQLVLEWEGSSVTSRDATRGVMEGAEG